jgi:hypothetical protein
MLKLYLLDQTWLQTLLVGLNMITVDENTALFNNVQNFLIQSKRFVQNP